MVILKGYLNIDEKSSGTAIYTNTETKYDSGKSTYTTTGRIKVDDSEGALTATKTITVTFSDRSSNYVPQIGAPIIINSTNYFTDETAAVFALANDVAYGTFRQNRDLKLTQAYTLEVTDAKAATLVLPFASKIPSGVSCYTLNYTTGNNAAKKTPVETTLPANTPVLINAEKDSYKFVSTATSGVFATGSDPVTVGALTGVYSEITVLSGSYILYKGEKGLGFYKSDGSNKVKANRAYLTAESAEGSRMFIGFDDETTGIDSVVKQDTKTADNVYYNLSGQRVANPSKGLYIVNGKKVIIK